MKPTERLANYIVEAKLSDFPDEVVQKAKQCILNEIGAALGGAQTELGQRHIAFAKDLGGRPDSTIIGDGTKISCAYAAHTNTELCVALDFDDEHQFTLTHPSSSVVSSALAAGEMSNLSGKEFITSVLVGYEVGLRIARSMRSIVTVADGKKEVMANPSYIVFASIAATSKALGLKAEEIINAFGIAGSTPINRGQSRVHLGTSVGHPYTDNKYDFGIYALLGVFSTFRGRRIAGPKGILDEDRFWTRCSATHCDHSELTKGLGKEFRVMEMTFKPVCFCAVSFCTVTDVREALKREKQNPKDIEEIKLIGIPKLQFTHWDTMVQAEFSLPCAIALAVTGYEPGPDWYTTGRYKDPDIFEIASKVVQVEDPKARELALESGQYMCTAEIKTKDGKIRRAHVEHEKGTPANPLSEDELHCKFMANSRGMLGQDRAEVLWDRLLHLEKARQISSIAQTLAKSV